MKINSDDRLEGVNGKEEDYQQRNRHQGAWATDSEPVLEDRATKKKKKEAKGLKLRNNLISDKGAPRRLMDDTDLQPISLTGRA